LDHCPDEAVSKATLGLEFVEDEDLRQDLRLDISAAEAASRNHEYKAATVIAGAVVWESRLFVPRRRSAS